MPSTADVTGAVASFYNELPFNYASPSLAAEAIRELDPIATYRDLRAELRRLGSGSPVLDVGCGAGWLVNSLAYHYGARATGLDLSQTAIRRARETSRELGVQDLVRLVCADVFAAPVHADFPVVTSIGVLHHTKDMAAALDITTRWVRSGGVLYLGLYHRHGRAPFLQLFERYREKQLRGELSAGEMADAFALYRRLHSGITDEEFLRSWFRDQVLHPHETQHTLAEVNELLTRMGLRIESTSLDGYGRTDLREIVAREPEQAVMSRQRNVVEHRYFPGFFTVLARRPV